MFPALTFTPRQRPGRRVVAGVVGGVLLAVSAATGMLAPSGTTEVALGTLPLRDRLAESTWALALPNAWLAAPVPEVRAGDSIDLIAVRQGDRPLAVPIAADIRVMTSDERSIVFQVDEESATAIATARASGLLIVPLLRSAR